MFRLRSKVIYRFCLIIIIVITPLFGGDNEEKLLHSLQSKYEKINDLTVDIIQRSGGKEILSGKLSYKKENKFHFDIKNNLIISDGLAIWNYNKRDKKVIVNDVDETAPSYFSFNRIVYDYPSECNISSLREGSSDVLIFVPKEGSGLNFTKAKLWINGDSLIEKIILEGVAAEDTEVIFSGYNLNQNLSDSKFKFTPPEGSTIIDLR